MSRYRWQSGCVIITIISIMAIIGPHFISSDPLQQNLSCTLCAPGTEFILGTDHLGRSVLSRLITGTLLAIVLAGTLGGTLPTLVLALSATLWCDYCRIARNITRSLKTSSHLEAGKILGFNHPFLIRHYILPELMPQLLTLASLGMGRTILNISGLGFLGIGLRPPIPEWGSMINQGLAYLSEAPWLVVAPGSMIFFTVLAFQLLGNSNEIE
jgi:peptide/nickel transport system permease protein